MIWLEAINGWANWLIAGDCGIETIKLRRYQLGRLAEHYVYRDPWDLDSADLAAWMSEHAWGRESKRSYRAAVRSFYAWGVIVGHADVNPAAALPTVPRKQHLPRPTPDDVYAAALTGAMTDQLRIALLLFGYTGLRRVEAARVHRDDVSNTSIRVHGKGDKGRIVPLHRLVRAELRAEFARRDAGGCGTGFRYTSGIHDGWLFPGQSGGHITPAGLGKIVSRALGPHWAAHTIRHRFACRTYENTHDLAVVQELLGHAKPETTRIYTLVPATFLAEAVDSLQ